MKKVTRRGKEDFNIEETELRKEFEVKEEAI